MTDLAARLIAFYLPQYHPIPENDEWWGRGFTEWTNVTKAKPLFPGHVQPHLPSELGFYDLRVPETRIAQADLAREHGIEGFCYWHYWFAGKRLLERPFEEVLKSGDPDYPFCLAWANQTWSGIWHGCPDRILIEQTYPGVSDYENHFRSLLPAFCDTRYITVDGCPLFIVYCPRELPSSKEFTDTWRAMAVSSGLPGLYLVAVASGPWDCQANGFDARITVDYMQWARPANWTRSDHYCNLILGRSARDMVASIMRRRVLVDVPQVLDYVEDLVAAYGKKLPADTYPSVMPNWDNTPRSGRRGCVFKGSTPQRYSRHLESAIHLVNDRSSSHRIVFIKSWNEWAEGNYLEPDQEYGRAYLEATRSVVRSRRQM